MIGRRSLALVTVGFFLGSPVEAADVVVPTGLNVVTIESNGMVQLLVQLPFFEIPENALLERARLRVPAPSQYPEAEVTLQIHPITAPWNGGPVEWSFLERTENGNVHRNLYGRLRVGGDRRPEQIVFDLSTIVAAVHDGLFVSGLCVTVAPYEGEGIPTATAGTMERLSEAQLEINFRERFGPSYTGVQEE